MYEFTKDMSEISGFGGSYEQACRNMLKAGLAWCDAHPNSSPKMTKCRGVFGIVCAENKDAAKLEKCVIAAAGKAPTGAMVHAVVENIAYVKRNGWDEFVTKMVERKRNDE